MPWPPAWPTVTFQRKAGNPGLGDGGFAYGPQGATLRVSTALTAGGGKITTSDPAIVEGLRAMPFLEETTAAVSPVVGIQFTVRG